MRRSVGYLRPEIFAITDADACSVGEVGYMARWLVQATLPHRDPHSNEFTRVNGQFTLSIMAPRAIGLPYGSIPRLLLAWITTEVVRTRQQTLFLGHSLSQFMRLLDMTPTGGRTGSITRLHNQTQRLLASSITCTFNGPDRWAMDAVRVADAAQLWWLPTSSRPAGRWASTLTLGDRFYRDIIERPVPVDLRVLKALRQSPLALDIYCWMTYRFSYLRKSTCIAWQDLQAQFGSEYRYTRQFKVKFLFALNRVLVVYPAARIVEEKNGLLLQPSRTHIGLRQHAEILVQDKPVHSQSYPRINGDALSRRIAHKW